MAPPDPPSPVAGVVAGFDIRACSTARNRL
jgi:hypothetical protein